jgi:hypothetical protein
MGQKYIQVQELEALPKGRVYWIRGMIYYKLGSSAVTSA